MSAKTILSCQHRHRLAASQEAQPQCLCELNCAVSQLTPTHSTMATPGTTLQVLPCVHERRRGFPTSRCLSRRCKAGDVHTACQTGTDKVPLRCYRVLPGCLRPASRLDQPAVVVLTECRLPDKVSNSSRWDILVPASRFFR